MTCEHLPSGAADALGGSRPVWSRQGHRWLKPRGMSSQPPSGPVCSPKSRRPLPSAWVSIPLQTEGEDWSSGGGRSWGHLQARQRMGRCGPRLCPRDATDLGAPGRGSGNSCNTCISCHRFHTHRILENRKGRARSVSTQRVQL